MANLLPQKYKKRVQRDYHLRLTIVTLVMVAGILVIGVTLLVSPYVLVVAKYDALVDIAEFEAGVEKGEMQDARAVLAQARQDMERVDGVVSYRSVPEEIIRDILAVRPEGVSLTRISFESETGNTRVVLTGAAFDRDDLRGFVNTLRTREGFESVDDPRSNYTYTDQQDLKFTLTVQLATP